jgi:peroxin-19
VLEDFTPASKQQANPPAATTATATKPDAIDEKALEAEMAKLFAGEGDPMAKLLGDLMKAEGSKPEAAAAAGDASKQKEPDVPMDKLEEEMAAMMDSPEFAKQMESFMSQLQTPKPGTGGAEAGATAGQTSNPTASADSSFQESMRRTLNRLQESNDQADAAVGADSDLFNKLGLDEDMLKKLMAGADDLGFDMGSEDGMEGLLKSLLGEMTDKEVLYEPMKELGDKYPGWLEANKPKLSEEEFKRYEAQARRVAEITAKFEEAGYSDGNPECRAFIMKRMEEVSVGCI